MKVLVVGSGGREHALVKKLSESNYVSEIHAIPGNDSMKQYANTYPEISDVDIEKIKGKCESLKITWAIIGPEAPLNIGLTDSLEEIGVKVFGPRKLEAQLESSKEFAKKIMQQYDIPTADYRVFYSKVEARKYIEEKGAPIVLKKDGLAAGKGVAVAMTIEDALKALDDMLDESTEEGLVIEEFLEGEEFSLMVLVNGSYILPFDIIAQDHKRAYDHDQGPNTGGMGAYAPVTHLGDKVIEEAIEKIVQPMADAMVEEGLNYFGVMYLGAIITKDGIKVIEFNARFGDPEAQILLSLLESDLIEVLEAVNAQNGIILITADHGNCEQMIDYKTGEPQTAHTTNPVPLILVGMENAKLKEGKLADLAPTMLDIMGLEKPEEMTGESIIESKNKIFRD